MFTWLNKQGVISDKGFVVQSINRFIIEYRESSKFISVSVERGILENGDPCIYIYLDEFNKWNDGTVIQKDKKEIILNNFKNAMTFQGVSVLTD